MDLETCFEAGQEVFRLTYPDNSVVESGCNGIEKITVVMEYGQRAGVPWFAVWRNGKIDQKHNAAHIACVDLDR